MNPSTLIAVLLALLGLTAALLLLRWLIGRSRRHLRPPVAARRLQRESVPAPARDSADHPARLPANALAQDATERVRRDIEQRVQTLRRAREHAEHWVPPAVDKAAPRRKAAKPARAASDDADWADTLFPETRMPDDEPPHPAR
ncbi:MAG: hypothetical protein LH480_05245 [Rubrivivax sp.]|nr:hypothetical protein [Rubrivivax sp.]